jgi:hypothetical protein
VALDSKLISKLKLITGYNKTYSLSAQALLESPSCLIEIGAPIGKQGRWFLLQQLGKVSAQGKVILWVHGHSGVALYPPAFFAYGLKPNTTAFICSSSPLKEAKQALINPIFDIIVLDLGLNQIKKADWVFLTQQARKNKQIMIVIQPYYLSNKLGNSWAKLRVNAYPAHQTPPQRILRGACH